MFRSAGTSPKNTARKRLWVSGKTRVIDVSHLQERVQKRVCEDLTKKTLPKVEAVKKALPSKAKATKKALPKATSSYRW